MAYIGSTPTSQNFTSGTDYFSGTGSQTAFTLTRTVNSVNDIEVVINNVVQQPSTAYTLSGTTITFTSAPSSGTNNIYVRYLATNMQSFTVPANSITRSQLDSNLQAGFQGRNRIINGAMTVAQRGTSVTVNDAAAFYAMDRWECQGASGDGVYTVAQSSTAPAGFSNSLLATVTTADASLGSTQSYSIRQKIEGYNIADFNFGTANAKTVTVSFWVRSSLTGTFSGALINGGFSRSYPFTYTISSADTWEQKSVTIAGDTSGTWTTDNTLGMTVTFALGQGSSRLGTAGAWVGSNSQGATGATALIATVGATLYLTGVQLEEGTTATSFERESYSVTLQKCQRYYETSFTSGKAVGASTDTEAVLGMTAYATSTTVLDFGASVFYKVPKRTTPSITFYKQNGTAGSWDSSSIGSFTPVGQWVNTNGFGFYTTNVSGATANRAYVCYGHFTASAEL